MAAAGPKKAQTPDTAMTMGPPSMKKAAADTPTTNKKREKCQTLQQHQKKTIHTHTTTHQPQQP